MKYFKIIMIFVIITFYSLLFINTNFSKDTIDDDTVLTTNQIYNQNIKSILRVYAKSDLNNTVGNGTGFCYMEDDKYLYIVTSKHLIKDCNYIAISFYNDKTYVCNIFKEDNENDLVILYLQKNEIDVDYTIVSNEESSAKIGDNAIEFGNSCGFGISIFEGIINNETKYYDMNYTAGYYVQISNIMNPGCSGGPTFDKYGKLIGINTCVINNINGMSYLIPTEILNKLIKENKKW